MNIHDFDDIRPYLPEELEDIYDKLLSDPEFCHIMGNLFAGVPLDTIADLMYGCTTNERFQKTMVYPFLMHLLADHSKGLTTDYSTIKNDDERCYTFVSNHRDIVLDSALLDYSLINEEFNTVEIAIGDNLLIRPWIKDLVRVNKSFIVQRSLNMRQMLLASAKLSKYMHFAINEKHEHLWIAQREGRAKDSNDKTQESVLKMMAMGGDLHELNIVPLAISYELDPCDYLKAEEFQHKRDIKGFKKSQQDDLENMRVGIFGDKGHIHYQTAPCINEWLDSLPKDMPKNDYFKAVAEHIDEEIYKNYLLYPFNYIAADIMTGSDVLKDNYSQEDVEQFEDYLQKKLSLVKIENADMDFLRKSIITMYGNPALNKLGMRNR